MSLQYNLTVLCCLWFLSSSGHLEFFVVSPESSRQPETTVFMLRKPVRLLKASRFMSETAQKCAGRKQSKCKPKVYPLWFIIIPENDFSQSQARLLS